MPKRRSRGPKTVDPDRDLRDDTVDPEDEDFYYDEVEKLDRARNVEPVIVQGGDESSDDEVTVVGC